MTDEVAVGPLSFVQRITLLGIASSVVEGEDPVDSRAVKERCGTHIDEVDAAVVSDPAERDMMRALGALGGKPYVVEEQPEQSPTGKGRPMYSLSADVEQVLDALAADERLEPAIEAVRE